VTWPGRLERLEVAGREVLLDGAHNPAGALALASAIEDLRPWLVPGPITLLTASMADKDVAGVVAALTASPALRLATILCTSIDVPRALSAEDLARTWRRIVPDAGRVMAVASVDDGLRRALASDPGPVVVAGSLYLVGAVRGRLVGGDAS